MQVIHYNEFGTKSARVVASYSVETDDVTAVIDREIRTATAWNRTEKRRNMRVNFILAGGMLRNIA